jgi:hypothetical protein
MDFYPAFLTAQERQAISNFENEDVIFKSIYAENLRIAMEDSRKAFENKIQIDKDEQLAIALQNSMRFKSSKSSHESQQKKLAKLSQINEDEKLAIALQNSMRFKSSKSNHESQQEKLAKLSQINEDEKLAIALQKSLRFKSPKSIPETQSHDHVNIHNGKMTYEGVVREEYGDGGIEGKRRRHDGRRTFEILDAKYFEVDFGVKSNFDTNMCFYLSLTDGERSDADRLKHLLSKTVGSIDSFYRPGVYADNHVVNSFVRTRRVQLTIYTLVNDKYTIAVLNPENTTPSNKIFLRLSGCHFTRLYPF